MFLNQPPINISNEMLYSRLSAARLSSLTNLAAALETRDSNIEEKLDDLRSKSAGVRAAGLRAIAEFANHRNREASIARDFTMASLADLDRLSTALEGRYSRAQSAMQSAKLLRTSEWAEANVVDIFVFYLAAVCDMSSPPDA